MKIVMLIAGLALAAAAPTLAATNLVTNGSFESSSYTSNSEFGVDFYNVGITQGVTGWTATLAGGYSHYWFPDTATTVNAANRFNATNEKLADGFTGASPDGGNFIGMDADFVGDDASSGYGPYNSPLVQDITGLTIGQRYDVDFYWGATQLKSRTGPTTNQIFVSLGGATQSTSIVNVASGGFTGWMAETFTFTATSATETLKFLAVGGPAGLPPYALLDGVSLTATVPEPATWAMMVIGFGLVGASIRRRRITVAA